MPDDCSRVRACDIVPAMRHGYLIVVIALLAACGGNTLKASHAATVSNTASVTNAATMSAAPTPSPTPLSFYAAQYLRIGKPCEDAQARLKALPDNSPDSTYASVAAAVATACQESNSALLRAQWPENVYTDIKAEVVADGPVLGDLADLINNIKNVVRDSGPANAAANIVRADLVLPPVK